MFDNIKLGQYIQFLRKSAGLTQGRLAETLGVSHQAVSNWERGESMPDIALLSRLSRELGTTVDRMLAAAEDFDPEKYKSFEASAPQAEPDAGEDGEAPGPGGAEEDPPEEKTPPERGAGGHPDEGFPDLGEKLKTVKTTIRDVIRQAVKGLDGIRGAQAVFVNIEDEIEGALEDAEGELEELAEDLRDAGEKRRKVEDDMDAASRTDEWSRIFSMAPFASAQTLDKLVEKLDVSKDARKLSSIAPFLSRGTLERLAKKAVSSGDPSAWDTVVRLAPFMDAHTLDGIVLGAASRVPLDKLSRLAPFLSRSAVDALMSRGG